jgi:hypothetical protein
MLVGHRAIDSAATSLSQMCGLVLSGDGGPVERFSRSGAVAADGRAR